MVPGERLSAVAKRRRLNGDTASPSSSPAPLKELVNAPLTNSQKPPDQVNSFDALIGTNSDRREFVKEIATVSSQAVVIRLSEGARCHISGVYGIWVKRGVVSINCALIDTTTHKRTIYAPRAYSIPSIIGQSKETAEFEVSEVEETLPRCFGKKHFLWATPDSIPLYRSFIILGLPSSSFDDFRPSELNDLYTEDARKTLHVFAKTSSAGTAPVVVLSGTRAQGISAHISMIVNHLLCALDPNKILAYPDGIIFVDFDSSIPEFGPPGTMSVVSVKSSLLGPSFSRPGVLTQSARSIRLSYILDQEWIDASSSTASLKHTCLRLLTQAVNLSQEHKNVPLLIKGCDYFDFLTDGTIDEIVAKLKISHVFSFCAHKASGNDRSGQFLATAAKAIFEEVHVPTGVEPSLVEQHKLSLQSHFYALQDIGLSQKKWSNSSFADAPHDEFLKALYYGEKLEQIQWTANITAIWPGFDHDHLADDDLKKTLTGSLVALVLEPPGHQPVPSDPAKTTGEQPRPVPLSIGSGSLSKEVDIFRDKNTHLPIVRGGCDSSHAKRCLGLGIIKNMDCIEETITLWTPVSVYTLQRCHKMHVSLHIYLIKRDAEGRNDTSWALGQ